MLVKKTISVLFILIFCILTLSGGAQEENPFSVKYPFSSAKITFSGNVGALAKQEEVLYIKDQRTARLTTTTTELGEMSNVSKALVITIPDYIYQIDFASQSGIKMINPEKVMLEEYNKLSLDEKKQFLANMEKLNEEIIAKESALGIKVNRLGEEDILGKKCEVYETMGNKIWVWKETREILKISGTMEKIATNIEENVEVAEEEFQVPAGIKVSPDPQDEMSKVMAKQMFQAIKEGKSFAEMMPMEEKGASPKIRTEEDVEIEYTEEQAQEEPEPAYNEPSIPHIEEESLPPEEEEEKHQMTAEEENEIREMYMQQGMDPALIDKMINMMKQGIH